MKRAYFLILPDVHLLDLSGPMQVISTLAELGLARVSIECIGPARRVCSYQGLWLDDVRPMPPALVSGDVVFVVGTKLDARSRRGALWTAATQWLRDVVSRAPHDVRICSVCTGSFAMAEAGLLDDRICTTHHRFTARLQREAPTAHVVANRVLAQDGNIITSAGVASGIDLALHVVAMEFGAAAALHVARENVIHFRRFGDDPELETPLRYRSHAHQRVHEVQDALSQDLSSRVTVGTVAARFGVSPRHLTRLFRAEAGVGIKQYQLEMRMDLARRLLAGSTLPLERIVDRCGFASVQAFRAQWNKRESLSPSAFRKQHRARDRT